MWRTAPGDHGHPYEVRYGSPEWQSFTRWQQWMNSWSVWCEISNAARVDRMWRQ